MTFHTRKNGTCVRRWLFPLTAIAIGLSPLFVLEGAFALLGWGTVDLARDPFVGFSATRSLFELDGDRYVISPSRRSFFAVDEFPAVKPRNAFRIFCLGGSTVQGNPYSIETSFTTWLELALKEIDPTRDWDVINCGGVSYASYRLVPILQECLSYQPDLFIICAGHNEFLEDRSYGHVRRIPPWLQEPISWLARTRTVTVTRQGLEQTGLMSSDRRRTATLGSEVDAMLDYRNGLAAYHRDDDWSAAVHRHYEANLRRMVLLARQAGVPVMLVKPPSNLGEQPPFKSEHDGALAATDLDRWSESITTARELFDVDVPKAATLLEQGSAIDPLHALTWYELGHCLETLGDFPRARRAYVQARDQDVCPLRMTSPLEAAMTRVVDDLEVSFLDAHELLETRTPHGILGGYWLVDHIHPSFEGHQAIAYRLTELLADQGFTTLPEEWQDRCRDRFSRYFASLDRRYFHRGQRKLRSLERWTQGNPHGPPVEVRFPHRLHPE